jgi:hypothetical protein
MTTYGLLACAPMSVPRPPRLAILAATLLVAGAACSSKDRRDQWYGTDVGVGWGDGAVLSEHHDAAATPDAAAASDAATDAAVDATVDAAAEAAATVTPPDAPAGETS